MEAMASVAVVPVSLVVVIVVVVVLASESVKASALFAKAFLARRR